jgi:hypothetical protein
MTTSTRPGPMAARDFPRVPDDPIPLPAGSLACRDCGIAVDGPFDPAQVTSEPPLFVIRPDGGGSPAPPNQSGEPMATCEDCQTRRAVALDLVNRRLPGGLSQGGFHLHGERLADLLARASMGLAALGKPLPDELDATAIRSLIERFGPIADLAWSARFAPHRRPDARRGSCAPYPFAHLGLTSRRLIRQAQVHFAADGFARTAPAMPVPPPSPEPTNASTFAVRGGCLMCGIGTVERPALEVVRAGGREKAAHVIWTPASTTSAALGGKPSPTHLAGFACPACQAIVRTHGFGPSAIAKAVAAAVDIKVPIGEDDTLDGAHGWGVRVFEAAQAGRPVPQPNREPWGHLDLTALR